MPKLKRATKSVNNREKKTLLFIHYCVVVVHNCNSNLYFRRSFATCWEKEDILSARRQRTGEWLHKETNKILQRRSKQKEKSMDLRKQRLIRKLSEDAFRIRYSRHILLAIDAADI